VFYGESKNYSGIFEKNGTDYVLIYKTNPPFVVRKEGKFVYVGYKGQTPQVYSVCNLTNPVLSFFSNLDQPERIFSKAECKQNLCALYPQKQYGKVFKRVFLTLKDGFPKTVVVERSSQNFVKFEFSKPEPCERALLK
jgi:hypothetical protein